ncbi:MAG TPA: M3 family oligoendopeptidase [Eubacteriales bacterium]|nr:M3 family oligoendopeptidase [Eubacteriales bacterium]
MKINEIEYKRCPIEYLESAFATFEAGMKAAKSAEECIKLREDFMTAVEECSTYASLANMRFTLDTRDEFYKGEKEYYDEKFPIASDLLVKSGELMLDSPFYGELKKVLNPIIFKSYEINRLAYSPSIIEEAQKENAIATEYSGLMSQMIFDYNGKKMPLSVLRGELSSADRAARKAAAEAMGAGLMAHREKLDELFSKLVENRDLQAKKMGYKDYVELGYYRMSRIDYNREMVEAFRRNVLTDIVPVVSALKARIAKRLGIDKVMFYDNEIVGKEGNARPKLDKEGIFAAAQAMYDEMDETLGSFFKSMTEAGAFDVDSREGKWGGGYCTEFTKFKQPFILANFNGTSEDIDVVTHEFGHAFAIGEVRKNGSLAARELAVGSMETAECHSMSMEVLCYRFMDKFFDEPEKYMYKHLVEALSFIPYGVMVDEFQHIAYENPALTPAERNAVWLELERKYRPHLDYSGIPYLEEGTRWQYQMHIYERPFYYIDYCLAQIVALSFLVKSRKDFKSALKAYLGFVKEGGTKLFSRLITDAELNNPFKEGTLKSAAAEINDILLELESRL